MGGNRYLGRTYKVEEDLYRQAGYRHTYLQTAIQRDIETKAKGEKQTEKHRERPRQGSTRRGREVRRREIEEVGEAEGDKGGEPQ